ncbi:MAG: hypothetical protein WBM09_07320 [Gallionella sp.]
MPAKLVSAACLASGRSPSVVASASATFGPSSGAITIAPITMVTLLCSRPMVATMADSTTIAKSAQHR